MKEKLEKIIKEIAEEMNLDSAGFSVEYPADLSFGDYATNLAMVASKKVGKNPRELAEEIKQKILEKNISEIESIDIAGLGFINFKIKDSVFIENITNILQNTDSYGRNELYKGSKTIVEYTDPNPLKIIHIGHLMSNSIGETISRITEFHGADVKRACYFGDTGVHIAKTMYALRLNKDKIDKTLSIDEQTRFLGKMYAEGNTLYEDNPEAKAEIDKLNISIYNKEQTEEYELYLWARQVSLDYFETIYKKIDTHFDFYFPESEVAPLGKKIVEEFKETGIFEDSDGAVVFKGEKYDEKLHTRVFINKFGVPTYEAKELALAKKKYDTYPYDVSVVVTANEISEYFKVIKKVMSFVFPELEKKTYHLPHGFLKLPDGKMSSRKGTVVGADTLISKVQEEVLIKMADRDIEEESKKDIAEKIAIGSIKYSILKQGIGKDPVFDFDSSLSFEGDSGPYLQYAYVRAQSIKRKADELGIKSDVGKTDKIYGLEKILYKFPEVIKKAGHDHSPQTITTYLTDLASEFNSFYAKEQIADVNDPMSPYKLALVESVAQVMKNGMWTLAIPVIEKM